jgi:dipeptidyl aminopeptidase/acylaminoacyl peptidase
MSRDGQRIAFVEDAQGRGVSGQVKVVDLNRQVTTLTERWESLRGLAWSANGDEIWFTAGDARSNRALRAVKLEGKDRVVYTALAPYPVGYRGGRARVAQSRRRAARRRCSATRRGDRTRFLLVRRLGRGGHLR